MSPCGKSYQGYVVWITAECSDVLLHPFKHEDLVAESEIENSFLRCHFRIEEA